MTKKQYFTIIRLTDEILQCDDTSSAIVIPWLHVIREHPVFLKEYEKVFNDGIIDHFSVFLKDIRNRLSIIYFLFKCMGS